MKKLGILLSLLLLITVSQGEEGRTPIPLVADNTLVLSEPEIFVKDGVTYAPAEMYPRKADGYMTFGKDVISYKSFEGDLVFTLGKDTALVDGEEVTCPRPLVVEEKVFLPLRFFFQNIGKPVNYDKNTGAALAGWVDDIPYPVELHTGEDQISLFACYDVKGRTLESQVGGGKRSYLRFSDLVKEVKERWEKGEILPGVLHDAWGKLRKVQVPREKRLYNEDYVHPDPRDPLVGTWWLKKKEPSDFREDTFLSISRKPRGEYEVNRRDVVWGENSSGLVIYGEFDEEKKILESFLSGGTGPKADERERTVRLQVRSFDVLKDLDSEDIFWKY